MLLNTQISRYCATPKKPGENQTTYRLKHSGQYMYHTLQH